MEQLKTGLPEEIQDQGKSSLNYQQILRTLILNWKWFVLSLVICVGIAAIYLRYTTPVYQATTKLLVKDDDSNQRGRASNSIAQAANLGIMVNTNGFDNEIEILKSRLLAEQTVRESLRSTMPTTLTPAT